METVAAAVETAIAAAGEIAISVATLIPAVHADPKKTDVAKETKTANLPDRIFRISHRWMIRHFPEEMTEDARPVAVSRTPEYVSNRKAPELFWQFRGLIWLKT